MGVVHGTAILLGSIPACSVAYHIYTALVMSKEEECDLYGIPSQWSTYPLGGRASMTSQSTYRELAPKHTARKVPVSQGRECQRETARRGPQYRRRCNMQSNRAGLSLSQHHSNVMGVRTRTLTGRGLLCLCLLHTRTLRWSLGELQFLTTACTVADFDLSQFTCGSLELKANSAL